MIKLRFLITCLALLFSCLALLGPAGVNASLKSDTPLHLPSIKQRRLQEKLEEFEAAVATAISNEIQSKTETLDVDAVESESGVFNQRINHTALVDASVNSTDVALECHPEGCGPNDVPCQYCMVKGGTENKPKLAKAVRRLSKNRRLGAALPNNYVLECYPTGCDADRAANGKNCDHCVIVEANKKSDSGPPAAESLTGAETDLGLPTPPIDVLDDSGSETPSVDGNGTQENAEICFPEGCGVDAAVKCDYCVLAEGDCPEGKVGCLKLNENVTSEVRRVLYSQNVACTPHGCFKRRLTARKTTGLPAAQAEAHKRMLGGVLNTLLGREESQGGSPGLFSGLGLGLMDGTSATGVTTGTSLLQPLKNLLEMVNVGDMTGMSNSNNNVLTGLTNCHPCQNVQSLGLGSLSTGLADLGLQPFNSHKTSFNVLEVPTTTLATTRDKEVFSLDILNSLDLIDQVSYALKEVTGLTTVTMSLTTKLISGIAVVPQVATTVISKGVTAFSKVPTYLIKGVTSVLNIDLIQQVPKIAIEATSKFMSVPFTLISTIGTSVWELGSQCIGLFNLENLYDLGSFSLFDVNSISSLLPNGLLGVGGSPCCSAQRSSCCQNKNIIKSTCGTSSHSHGHSSSQCGNTDTLFGITITDVAPLVEQQTVAIDTISNAKSLGAQLGVVGGICNNGYEVAVTKAASNLQTALTALPRRATQSNDWLALIFLIQSLRDRVDGLEVAYEMTPSQQLVRENILTQIDGTILPSFSYGVVAPSTLNSLDSAFSSLYGSLSSMNGWGLTPKTTGIASQVISNGLSSGLSNIRFDLGNLAPNLGYNKYGLLNSLGNRAVNVPTSAILSNVAGGLGDYGTVLDMFETRLGTGGVQDLLGTKFLGNPFSNAQSQMGLVSRMLLKSKALTGDNLGQTELLPMNLLQGIAVDETASNLISFSDGLGLLQNIGNRFASPIVSGLSQTVGGITGDTSRAASSYVGGAYDAQLGHSIEVTGRRRLQAIAGIANTANFQTMGDGAVLDVYRSALSSSLLQDLHQSQLASAPYAAAILAAKGGKKTVHEMINMMGTFSTTTNLGLTEDGLSRRVETKAVEEMLSLFKELSLIQHLARNVPDASTLNGWLTLSKGTCGLQTIM